MSRRTLKIAVLVMLTASHLVVAMGPAWAHGGHAHGGPSRTEIARIVGVLIAVVTAGLLARILRARAGGRPLWPAGRAGAGLLAVTVAGGAALVGFTAPSDAGDRGLLRQATVAGGGEQECRDAALGTLLAGGALTPGRPCPADRLQWADSRALRTVLAVLGERGVGSVRLVTDDSARSAAAAAVVTDQARAGDIKVRPSGRADAVVVLAGADAATADLTRSTRSARPPVYGTYLAPWLATPAVISAAGGAALVALPFDPAGAEARDYLTALRRIAPDAAGSSAGFAAYRTALGQPSVPTGPVQLFAATGTISIMPSDLGPGHQHGSAASWLAGGALTPVRAG